jgi:hypothetical protein
MFRDVTTGFDTSGASSNESKTVLDNKEGEEEACLNGED